MRCGSGWGALVPGDVVRAEEVENGVADVGQEVVLGVLGRQRVVDGHLGSTPAADESLSAGLRRQRRGRVLLPGDHASIHGRGEVPCAGPPVRQPRLVEGDEVAEEGDLVYLDRLHGRIDAGEDVAHGQHPPDHLRAGASLQRHHRDHADGGAQPEGRRREPHPSPLRDHGVDDRDRLVVTHVPHPGLGDPGVHQRLRGHEGDRADALRLDLDGQQPTVGVDTQRIALVSQLLRHPAEVEGGGVQRLEDRAGALDQGGLAFWCAGEGRGGLAIEDDPLGGRVGRQRRLDGSLLAPVAERGVRDDTVEVVLDLGPPLVEHLGFHGRAPLVVEATVGRVGLMDGQAQQACFEARTSSTLVSPT